ncbi:MAG: hypothetical protein KA712_25565 [Myxococcales bacterium]|nr:hypothetical protein [Myxococcales bacterium]
MIQTESGRSTGPRRKPIAWLASALTATLFASSLGLVACGGSQKKNTANAAGGSEVNWGMGNIDRSRCRESGKQVVTADTNQDNEPDVWKFYAEGGETQRLSCKQVDLNLDSKVDLIDHYGDDGKVEMSEFDLDFDGRFDQTVFYSAGKRVRLERDMDFNARPDYVEFYENGKVARVERDANGDGRVDEWQYYENGKLDRIGYDTKGDGKADKWDRAAEEPQAQAEAEPAAAATEPGAAGTEPPAP